MHTTVHQVRIDVRFQAETAEDKAIFCASLAANPYITTCSCTFAGSSKHYVYMISREWAEAAQPGDLAIVDHNSEQGFKLVTIEEIHDIPAVEWSDRTRTVLAVASNEDLHRNLIETESMKTEVFNIAKEKIRKQREKAYKKDRKKLQKSLGLDDYFKDRQQKFDECEDGDLF